VQVPRLRSIVSQTDVRNCITSVRPEIYSIEGQNAAKAIPEETI